MTILHFKLAVVTQKMFGKDNTPRYAFVDDSKRFFTISSYSGGVTGSGIRDNDIRLINGKDYEQTKFVEFLV